MAGAKSGLSGGELLAELLVLAEELGEEPLKAAVLVGQGDWVWVVWVHAQVPVERFRG